MPDQNGWNQWSMYVLKELERLSKAVKEMGEDIVTLKIKSSFWGVLGGAVAAVIFMLLAYYIRGGKIP